MGKNDEKTDILKRKCIFFSESFVLFRIVLKMTLIAERNKAVYLVQQLVETSAFCMWFQFILH